MQRRSLEVVSVAILALVAIVVFYRVYSFGQERFFTVDEYQYAHATWLVSEGERPYVDFYEHHFPLSYVAHAPLVWADGAFAEKVLRLRALVFGYLLGVSLLLGWATWRRTRDRCAALLALTFPAAFGFSLMSANSPVSRPVSVLTESASATRGSFASPGSVTKSGRSMPRLRQHSGSSRMRPAPNRTVVG